MRLSRLESPTPEWAVIRLCGFNDFIVLGRHACHCRAGIFPFGGTYQTIGKSEVLVGQMYVWYQIPKQLRRPYPVVLVHGGGQTGTNFLRTPDGRPGWADFFLQEGYTVYVIDWPGQGKSNYVAPVYGPPGLVPTEARERQFTAPKEFTDIGPQAQKHTQWPGSGRKGDPIFDHFLASQSITPTEIVKGAAPLNEKLTADSVTSFERESPRICECYNLGRGVVPTVFWGY